MFTHMSADRGPQRKNGCHGHSAAQQQASPVRVRPIPDREGAHKRCDDGTHDGVRSLSGHMGAEGAAADLGGQHGGIRNGAAVVAENSARQHAPHRPVKRLQ